MAENLFKSSGYLSVSKPYWKSVKQEATIGIRQITFVLKKSSTKIFTSNPETKSSNLWAKCTQSGSGFARGDITIGCLGQQSTRL